MKNITFSSTKSISKTVTTLLYVGISLSFINVVLNCAELAVYHDVGASKVEQSSTDETISYLVFVVVLIPVLLVYIATIVTFLIWLHRSYKNLLAFGVNGLKASPGWAVGYWFIPILNLFKPLLIVNEVWNNSGYRQGDARRVSYSNTSSPKLHASWWFAWIVLNVSGRIGSRMVWRSNDSTTEYFGHLVIILSEIASILAAFCLIKIIANITQRQEINAANHRFHMPPEPPNFD